MAPSLDVAQMDLLKTCLFSSSKAGEFYSYILNDHLQGNHVDKCSLVGRCLKACSKNGINLTKFLCEDSYARKQRRELFPSPEDNGLLDSVRHLLCSRDPYSSELLNLLLKSFQSIFVYCCAVVIMNVYNCFIISPFGGYIPIKYLGFIKVMCKSINSVVHFASVQFDALDCPKMFGL